MSKYEVLLEKYRPRTLDDVIGQDEIIERLKAYVKLGGFPNLMFVGPPGTGKTTSSICLALDLHRNLNNFKELNTSDTRGIDTVRNQIKEYASTQPIGDVDFKIIFLDECDNLTSDAQSALRRTMEKYSNNCKFILSCNYSSKVIEPIQSRSAIYRFKGINPESMKKRILYIAEKEKFIVSNEVLDAIVYVSNMDLRKAVNSLEMASLINKTLTVESIFKSSGLVHPTEIIELITFALKGNFKACLNKLDELIIGQGFSSIDILRQLFTEVLNLNINDRMKVDIIDKIGECDFRVNEGSDEMIQMKSLMAQIIKLAE